MFEWLDRELNAIRTRNFHVVDGPASPSLRAAIEQAKIAIPGSYKDFALRFGNAKLYRMLSYYIVGVLASPVEEHSADDGECYRIGHFDSSSAYFIGAFLKGDDEAPVFEPRNKKLIQVADGFEEWLTKKCKAARRMYSKSEWEQILTGPSPFTKDELMILQARKLFTCKAIAVTPEGKVKFEVFNGSDMTLPFLSIGIRQRYAGMVGGLWLPVSHIRPHHTGIIEHDVYAPAFDLSDVEVFEEPDPEPEDRDRYWEFKKH